MSRLPRATPPPPPLDCPVHHRNGGTGRRATSRWSAAQLEEIARLRSVSSRREVAAFYLPYLHVPSVGGPHHHGASPPHGFPQAADVRETCITGILLHEEETINLRRPEYRYVSICAQQHALSVSKAGCYRCSTSCTTSLTLESRVREDVRRLNGNERRLNSQATACEKLAPVVTSLVRIGTHGSADPWGGNQIASFLVCSNHNDSLTTKTRRKPKWLRMARLRTRLRVDA